MNKHDRSISLHICHSHTSLCPPSLQVPLFRSSQPPGQCWHPLSFWSLVKSSSSRNPLWPGDPGCPPAAGAMTAVLLWHTQVWILELAPRCCGLGCWSSVVLLFPVSGSSVCPARASLCGPGHPVGCILQLLRCRLLHCRQNLGTSDWTNANGAWGSASHQIPSSPIRTSSTGFRDEGYGVLNPPKHGDERSGELWSQSPLSTVSLCCSVTSSLIAWPPPPPSTAAPLFFYRRWNAVLCSFCSCDWDANPPSKSTSLFFFLSPSLLHRCCSCLLLLLELS